MCRTLILGLVGLLIPSQLGSEGSPTRAEALLVMGITQVGEGDFETAVFTLDSAIRRLTGQPLRTKQLAEAYLYLGVAYVGLDHEKAAKGKFREAARLDPTLRPAAERFSARVIELFEGEQLKLRAAKSKRGRTLALSLAGAGGLAALAVSAAANAPPGNRPPTAAISITPEGQAITGITTMNLTASANDPDGDALTYAWDLGDGMTAAGPTVAHIYKSPGAFQVLLTASDPRGGSVTLAQSVTVGSLSGTWQSGHAEGNQDHACTQTGTLVDCPPLFAKFSPHFLVWRVTLADPRKVVDGELLRVGGDHRRCVDGDVASTLDVITCIESGTMFPRVLRRKQ